MGEWVRWCGIEWNWMGWSGVRWDRMGWDEWEVPKMTIQTLFGVASYV